MSASWSSGPEQPRAGARAWAGVRRLALLLGLWGCERGQPPSSPPPPVVNASPYPYPLCLEPIRSAEDRVGCLIEDYLKTRVDMTREWRKRACARDAYALAEQHFTEGRFGQAWDLFGNSSACISSYQATAREGDAVIHEQLTMTRGRGGRSEMSDCISFPPEGLEFAVMQTYETALLFYPFELEQTGVQVPEHELMRTRYKADCLRRLARRHGYLLVACISPSLLRQCLEQPG